MLWFAFKKLYLWSDKQLTLNTYVCPESCDLLSKNCIFDLINNSDTMVGIVAKLWFAFKKLYLWSDKQPRRVMTGRLICCDLLSKNCIFDLINNAVLLYQSPEELWFAFKKLYLWSDKQLDKELRGMKNVVICFQKIVSLIW